MNIPPLILTSSSSSAPRRRFFVYPTPKGSEENQFTPLGAGVNKLIFERLNLFYPLNV
jgi:hypothetical protein